MVTSLMVGISCGMLGCFIVLRNMSLIGDALSHSILPGIYAAFIIFGYSTLGFFTGSVIAGLATAIAITWIQRNVKTKSDAAIGIVFTAMFSLGVMGISRLNNTQGNHLDLKDFLFGNVLGISNEDILLTAIIMVYTVSSIIIFYRYLFIATFQEVYAETMGISTRTVHYFLMLMLSFAVVAALRSVGVILVVAMLITPASTAMLLSNKLRSIIWISAFIGGMASVLGLVFAIAVDTTPGPAMVVVATGIFIISSVFAPGKGLLDKWWAARKEKIRIAGEDILKKMQKDGNYLNSGEVSNVPGISAATQKSALKNLTAGGFIDPSGAITPKGKDKASELVRAHRLWESYQVQGMGLNSHQIHDDAERIEHHLSSADIDEIEKELGFPLTDPHGSPIPPKSAIDPESIFYLKPNERARISGQQANEHIEAELWELGLIAQTPFTVIKMDNEFMYLRVNSQSRPVPVELAKKIRCRK